MTRTNIVLLGYMGSGKTVIGRHTARLLDMEFADTDEIISSVTGLSLPQLLRKHGEIRFRSEEQLAINKLSKRDNLVIACGGNLPPSPEDLALLANKGYFVLLTADPTTIAARLSRKNNRPINTGKLKYADLAELTQERQKLLQPLSNLTVDTSSVTVEEAAKTIADAFLAQ